MWSDLLNRVNVPNTMKADMMLLNTYSNNFKNIDCMADLKFTTLYMKKVYKYSQGKYYFFFVNCNNIHEKIRKFNVHK